MMDDQEQSHLAGGKESEAFGSEGQARPTLRASWQPIASAPKDGRNIWLGATHSIRIGFWSDGADNECHGSIGGGWKDLALSESGISLRDLPWEPTHWMELPQPPQRTDILREGFESWVRGTFPVHDLSRDEDDYAHPATSAAWRGWCGLS